MRQDHPFAFSVRNMGAASRLRISSGLAKSTGNDEPPEIRLQY